MIVLNDIWFVARLFKNMYSNYYLMGKILIHQLLIIIYE